ncbi:MAG: hypothetical protein H7039_06760 [Bryobacteraceae bacterium]|nr:hypothetical protein [Bryobacteraceae bacterium]
MERQSHRLVAGAGDALTTIPFTTFSVTAWGRRVIPGGDSTNAQSASYRVSGWFGTRYQMLLGTAVGGTAGAVSGGKYGPTFGRGGKALLNRGPVRFGWYWDKTRDAIGLRIFERPNTIHIPFWHP